MRRLDETSRRLLRERLDQRGTALPFVEAVALQLAHPPGRTAPLEVERAAAERAVLVLRLADAGPAAADASDRLLDDPELLAAVFQNVDLLYQHGDPRADAVSALVMRTMERAGPHG